MQEPEIAIAILVAIMVMIALLVMVGKAVIGRGIGGRTPCRRAAHARQHRSALFRRHREVYEQSDSVSRTHSCSG